MSDIIRQDLIKASKYINGIDTGFKGDDRITAEMLMKEAYIAGLTEKQANEAPKQPGTKALALNGVMPRSSFLKDQLTLKNGARLLNVRGVLNMDMPHVMLNVIENWQPMDEFEDEEIDDATYYLTSDEIDKLIDKLRDGKAFLNGA